MIVKAYSTLGAKLTKDFQYEIKLLITQKNKVIKYTSLNTKIKLQNFVDDLVNFISNRYTPLTESFSAMNDIKSLLSIGVTKANNLLKFKYNFTNEEITNIHTNITISKMAMDRCCKKLFSSYLITNNVIEKPLHNIVLTEDDIVIGYIVKIHYLKLLRMLVKFMIQTKNNSYCDKFKRTGIFSSV